LSCKPDDQIILSDLDEIPNPHKIFNAAKLHGLKIFEQKLYYYYLNKESVELSFLPWSIMFDYSLLSTPQDMREKLKAIQASILGKKYDIGEAISIKSGGWHFSYLGGVDAILNKIKAFADPEYGKTKYRDIDRIKASIKNGNDLFGRDLSFVTVPIDRSFPDFIRINQANFKGLIDEY
jgi:beta-1,4-mannosyl-glycoprotein beta-1,4-N-acetylglucosaminyltransferase